MITSGHSQPIQPVRLEHAVTQGWCRWEECIDAPVVHNQWGVGTIVALSGAPTQGQTVWIEFAPVIGRRRFQTQTLATFFTTITVPPGVRGNASEVT